MTDTASVQPESLSSGHLPPLPVGDTDLEAGMEEEQDQDLDPSPFLEYLKSPQGHELAGRVVGIKKAALSHSASEVKLDKMIQIAIVVSIVAAATTLAILDKFSAPVGILFGTLVAYVFGKKA